MTTTSTAADRSDAERTWVANVTVMPKDGVNDPEGEAILGGVRNLGYGEVQRVRAGRYFTLTLSAPDVEGARARVAQLCERLLANPVIQSYRFEITEASASESPGERSR